MVSTEIFVPSRKLTVVGGKHPLTNEHRQVEVPTGMTIAEALDATIAGTGLDWPPDRFVATVNDVRVPREYWTRVKPKPGTLVVFRPVASGDSALRSLLFLGVAVAALFIAPYLAPGLAGALGITPAIASSLIGGAITLGGAFLLNALIPLRPSQQDSAQPKTLPMISGASNEVRPWGPIPVVLGTHRLSPMFAAMPYSQWSGQKQYMNLAYCCGYGRLQITRMRIGTTPIEAFEEVTTEIDDGRKDPSEGPLPNGLTLFPRNVNEDPLGLTIKSADGWVERAATGLATKIISLDLIAPGGIFSFNTKTGNYDDRPVTINVRYKNKNDPPTAWIDRPDVVFTRNRDPYRLGSMWTVDTPGAYLVQVKKATTDYTGTGQVADTIQWATIRAYETGNPINFKKQLALVALKARATDQFNGVISTFNCVVSSYVKHWDKNTATWTGPNHLSSNPGDLFMHVLTGPANARPRQPYQIDYQSIQDWAEDCDTRGYTYNAVITDQRTVREVLADIAAAGRATVALRNGKWGVSFPRDSDPVSWHFTPRNSSGLKTTRTYREMPHALRVRYIRASKDWQQTEGIVYNDKTDGSGGMHTAATATLFESVEFPGITDWNNVHLAGRYQLAQALLRPETHTLNADIESLRLERGDKVMMSDDVLLIGTGYGRVTDTDPVHETCTVDSRVIMEVGKTYQIKFTLDDGTFLTRTVLNSGNETDFIQFDTNDASSAVPAVGNLFSFGESQKVTNDYRVLDVRPGPDLTAQFTLVDDAPGIEFPGPVPEYDPGITDPPDPFDQKPKSLAFAQSFSGSGITTKSIVTLTVIIPRVGTIQAFEYQVIDLDTSPNVAAPNTFPWPDGYWMPFAVVPAPYLYAVKENMEAGHYSFRVRAIHRGDVGQPNNASSTWVYPDPNPIVTVVGVLAPPPDITPPLRYSIQGDIMVLDWDAVAAINLSHYRVKYSALTDGTATWASSNDLFTTVTNRAGVAAHTGTYFVKAVSYAGVESVNDIESTILTSPIEPSNILVTINEGSGFIRFDGTSISPPSPLFPGPKTFTQVQGVLLTLTKVGSIYTTNQGFYEFGNYGGGTYFDLGFVYTSQVTAIVNAHGTSAGNTMDTWVTLAGLAALEADASPADWSIETVYQASQGPQVTAKSIQQIITDQGLTANLKLLLEAGKTTSWPGTGQKWLDESGLGYDFFLGLDGTVATNDPTFNGVPGHLTRDTYWAFDGGDWFTYDTVNETWMDSIHKDSAKVTFVTAVYVATLDTSIGHYLAGTTTTGGTQTGFQLLIVNNKISFQTTNGTATPNFSSLSTIALATTGWHVIGFSIDEAAATNNITFMIDGVTQVASGVYSSPSAAAATNKLNVGAAAAGAGALQNGWRMHSMAMWQGVALTAAQLAALGSAIYHNDDFIWSPWTPFAATDITARALKFGIRLNGSADGQVSPAVANLAVTIDMPDRHLGFNITDGGTPPHGSGTSPSGYTINFNPPFKKLKSIALANYQLDTSIGEKYTILSSDENHVTIVFSKPGTPSDIILDRTFSLHAYGYGMVVT